MPRLRTTTTLSLFALIVGVAGTGWLSAQTGVWLAASPSTLTSPQPARAARPASSAPRPRASRHHAMAAIVQRARHADPSMWDEATASAEPASTPTLIPVSTPPAATPYERLRGHLDGSVLLHVSVDGSGRVRQAAVARSSGDPVLDSHALSVVDGWRFAVPVDHPEGLSGELPLRFDTGARLARTP